MERLGEGHRGREREREWCERERVREIREKRRERV